MKIGELSRRSGVSIRMLRYYESKGVLSPSRSHSAYRTYGDEDLERVGRISALNAAGLPLDLVRRILPRATPGVLSFRPCDTFTSGLQRRLAEVEDQIAVLQARRQVLADLLSTSMGNEPAGNQVPNWRDVPAGVSDVSA